MPPSPSYEWDDGVTRRIRSHTDLPRARGAGSWVRAERVQASTQAGLTATRDEAMLEIAALQAHPLTVVLSRKTISTLVCLGLATAIHVDWHLARPAEHHLSLGLPWHWTLAIPTFGAVAWYVVRTTPHRLFRTSVSLLACAILIAGALEPAWEYFLGGATREWAFGRARLSALTAFVAVGLAAYVATIAVLRRADRPGGAA